MNRSRRQDMSYGSGRPPGSGPIASAKPRTRIIAVAATLAVFGGIVAVTQVSNAETRGRRPSGSACATSGPGATESPAPTIAPGEPSPGATAGSYAGDEPGVQHHIGDGQAPADAEALAANNNCTPAADNDDDNDGDNNDGDNGDNNNDNNDGDNGDDNDNNGGNNGRGLDVLGDSCDNSRLGRHDGFQEGNRCVATAFGEVGDANRNASLLISSAPQRVRVNQGFTIRVSTRNLVRDRFLAAAQGGYYKESSFLDENGLVRGHFHTACRMLESRRVAPDPDPAPEFFVATEDGRGGARPDEVSVQVPGLPETGVAQCAVWAGDGSHRVPMMERANQIPAFDVVRITVTR